MIALCSAPLSAQSALASPLTGLLSKASYMNVFFTWVNVKHPPFEPEDGEFTHGLGFELAFGLPGGQTQPRTPISRREGTSCLARYSRNELALKAACADTTVKSVTRTISGQATTFEEVLEIKPFSWEEPTVTLDLGVSFAQSGAFVHNDRTADVRASLRELPALTLYATFQTTTPTWYLGARTGFLSLYNGRAYRDTTMKFNAETLQLGPVIGMIQTIKGVDVFIEAAYLWREFRTVDWETAAKVPAVLPHRIDLSGASLLVGLQFDLAKSP